MVNICYIKYYIYYIIFNKYPIAWHPYPGLYIYYHLRTPFCQVQKIPNLALNHLIGPHQINLIFQQHQNHFFHRRGTMLFISVTSEINFILFNIFIYTSLSLNLSLKKEIVVWINVIWSCITFLYCFLLSSVCRSFFNTKCISDTVNNRL